MIAICRAILAAVFLVAVWIDPDEPARAIDATLLALSGYLMWTIALAITAWRSWWWDFRIALAVHVIDLVVFITAVFVTETGDTDFGSPFIASAAFLLLAGGVRWRWRGAMLTGVVLTLAYGGAGFILLQLGLIFDPYQFGRRVTYIIVLSVMIVWLSIDPRFNRIAPMPEPAGIPGKRRPQVLAGALAYARHTFHARSVAIVLTGSEEPWIDLFRDTDGVFMHQRVAPEAFAGVEPMPGPTLFDQRHRRRIIWHASNRYESQGGPVDLPLAAAVDAPNGLLAEFTTASESGQVLIWSASDSCIDDLPVMAQLAEEIGRALDREEMAMLAQSIAVSHARSALARDLHDSAAQFIAGTQFRLEAMRRRLREGADADTEIAGIKAALRSEQGHMRAMIEHLRAGVDADRSTDLVAELESLTVELGHHWHVATALRCARRTLAVPIHTAYELRQLVREAVANAVRHGNSSRVDLDLDQPRPNCLMISIADNGKGLPEHDRARRPLSISERVEALGGQLQVVNTPGGLRLEIALPVAAIV